MDQMITPNPTIKEQVEEMIDARYPNGLLVFLEHSRDSTDVITAIVEFITADPH